MSRVSILITVFNCERFISESIRSAIDQDHDDFEVLVVDDGSTDGTAELLKAFDDPRIRVFTCARIGRLGALNYGLDQSRSEFVAILDADDVSLVDRIRIQESYLQANPAIALVGSRYRVFIDEFGATPRVEDVGPTSFEDIISSFKAGVNCVFHSSVMFRREAVLKIGGYDPTILGFGDWDLYVRLSSNNGIANIDRVLSLKRLHPAQFFAGQNGIYSTPEGRRSKASLAEKIARLPWPGCLD